MCKAIEDMKADARSEGRNEGILTTVSILKDMNLSKDAVIEKIETNYALSNEEAVAMVNSRW
ncbi:MAG: hypothetical protein IJU00_10435 [Selenomonas sp.]|nr:hypothetical protein [Selenomonas sp.]